ncbi:hypothetical protein ACJW30_03G048000 [Castanea mollissima]
MYNEIALDTKVGQIAFFATEVASELRQIPNAGQLVVMEFSFNGEWKRRTSDVNVEVAPVTTIIVFKTLFSTDVALAKSTIFFFVAIIFIYAEENKRMIWV